MAERVKGILFDLGDTLINFGRFDVRACFRNGAKLAHEYLHEQNLSPPPFEHYHRRLLFAVQWRTIRSKIIRREFDSGEVLANLHTRMGVALTAEQLAELAWRMYTPLSQCGQAEPNVVQTLTSLTEAGLTLGVVSNTFLPGDVLDRHLRREGMIDLLPVRIYSCDVLYRKPHPEIFRIALERNALAAEQTLFVGDLPHADVRGSNRMGMISVLKDPEARHSRAKDKPKHRIRRLEELLDVIKDYDPPAGKP